MRTIDVGATALGLVAGAFALCGCAVVAVGAAGGVATAKVLSNQTDADYQASVRDVYAAALVALPALGYPAATTSTLGPTEAEIVAGDARLAMAEHPGGVTRVAVKIGTWDTADHQRRAGLIHDRIRAELARRVVVPVPAPAPATPRSVPPPAPMVAPAPPATH